MLRSFVALAVLAAVALTGCAAQSSSSDSSSNFKGEQRLVANTVEDFESAASKGDQGKICRDLLAKELVAQYAQHGGSCDVAVDDALKNSDSFGLDVQKVTITGSEAAVTVKADRGKKDIDQGMTLVKQGPGWRISAFKGR
jgi:outer membrane lipoprotein SlyB